MTVPQDITALDLTTEDGKRQLQKILEELYKEITFLRQNAITNGQTSPVFLPYLVTIGRTTNHKFRVRASDGDISSIGIAVTDEGER